MSFLDKVAVYVCGGTYSTYACQCSCLCANRCKLQFVDTQRHKNVCVCMFPLCPAEQLWDNIYIY